MTGQGAAGDSLGFARREIRPAALGAAPLSGSISLPAREQLIRARAYQAGDQDPALGAAPLSGGIRMPAREQPAAARALPDRKFSLTM